MPLVADAVAVIVNLVLLACALPLAMRLVPLQNLFGFRTKASTASEKAWYTLNAAFGKTVSAICGAAVAAGAVMLGVRYGTDAPFWEYGFALLYAVAAVSLAAGVAATRIALRRTDDDRE